MQLGSFASRDDDDAQAFIPGTRYIIVQKPEETEALRHLGAYLKLNDYFFSKRKKTILRSCIDSAHE